ncbi:hypothetical protein Tco_1286214 [Tanacetum coccineum]
MDKTSETMASQTDTVVPAEGVRGGPGYKLKKRPSILDLRTAVPGEALEAGGVIGRGATIVMWGGLRRDENPAIYGCWRCARKLSVAKMKDMFWF